MITLPDNDPPFGRHLDASEQVVFPGSAVSIRVVRGYLGLEDQLGFSDREGSEVREAAFGFDGILSLA